MRMKKLPDRGEKRTAILIFLILLSCYAYFFPRWADWNQNTRLDLTFSIVEEHSFSIDTYHTNTGDKLLFEGNYYCDKAPGLSFAAVPLYAAIRPVLDSSAMAPLLDRVSASSALEDTLNPEGSGVNEQKARFAIAQYVLTLTLVCLPSALLGVLLYRFLARFTSSLWPRLVLVLAYGLGTTALPYATSFYSHQPGAILTFVAFFLVFRVRWEGAPRWHLWLTGALLGYAVITEYPTALIAAAVGLYAVLGLRDWKAGVPIVLAAAPSVLLWMIYNQVRLGAPLELGYQYHATFTQHAQAGFAGLAGPRWQALWDITFGRDKGLFFRSPILFLALPGGVMLWRDRRYRVELACSIFIVVGYFLYAASFYDWGGGHTAGPRYLVAMLPFMLFPIVRCFDSRRWSWSVLLLTSVSIALVGAETIAGQHFPYQDLSDPWREYIWPSWQGGDIARNLGTILGLPSWYSLIPLLIIVVGGSLWLSLKSSNLRLRAS
jgi:hypothetical protein